MTLQDLLTSLGLNIASNAIYEFIKTFFAEKANPTQEEYKEALKAFLSIENAQIYSDKIIDFLAANGDIIISGSSIQNELKTMDYQRAKLLGMIFPISHGMSWISARGMISILHPLITKF